MKNHSPAYWKMKAKLLLLAAWNVAVLHFVSLVMWDAGWAREGRRIFAGMFWRAFLVAILLSGCVTKADIHHRYIEAEKSRSELVGKWYKETDPDRKWGEWNNMMWSDGRASAYRSLLRGEQ